jgi:glycosyltransferase involved in cell wall biosynthesis
VSVIHLGFELHKLDCNQYIITDKPYLLYIGWREWYKNFGSFLKCYSTSKRLMKDFNIVAFGGGNFSNIEKQLFKSLGIQEGQVIQVSGDDDKLANYYCNATAFVFPSLYEGFGLPPLEAMAHDCPVISSNTSSMPEVIGDAAEYFDPKSEEQTVHAIENVVYSETRKKELIMKGRKRHKRFSWAKCSNETHEIYKQFL